MFLAIERYMLPCLNKQLFGLDCPGCGLQRSFILLFKGNFIEAFYMYPAIYTLVLLAVFLGFNHFYKFKYDTRFKNVLIVLNVSVIVISYIYKIINHHH